MPDLELHSRIAEWIGKNLEQYFHYYMDWRKLKRGVELPDKEREIYYSRHHFQHFSEAIVHKQKQLISEHVKKSRDAFLHKSYDESLINLGIAIHYIQDLCIPHEMEKSAGSIPLPTFNMYSGSFDVLDTIGKVRRYLDRRLNRNFLRHMGQFGEVPYVELYIACYISIVVAGSVLKPNPAVDQLERKILEYEVSLIKEAAKLELIESSNKYDGSVKKRYLYIVKKLGKDIDRYMKKNNAANKWFFVPKNVVEDTRMEIHSNLSEEDKKKIEMLPEWVEKHHKLRKKEIAGKFTLISGIVAWAVFVIFKFYLFK